MKIDKITYDKNLHTLINIYKPQIKINEFTKDYDLILKYINNIQSLISGTTKSQDILFLKSALALLLPFTDYKPYRDGFLISDSVNSKFTIADVSIGKHKERIFIKIIDIPNPNPKLNVKDHIIYDVIASIIFDDIFKKDDTYKKFIPEFKGCFITTYANYSTKSSKYWNYNEIKDFKDNRYSPFSYFKIKENLNNNDMVLNVMYEAINNPIDLLTIFKEKYNDPLFFLDILNKCCEIYELLKYLGLNYGFMHNDLHFGNILYDKTTTQLKLIDFGRSSFGKYVDEKNNDVMNKIKVEYTKLNYNQFFNLNLYHPLLININILKEYLYTPPQLFYYAYSPKFTTDKYFGVIFDLITFSLNIYIRTIFFFKRNDNLFYENEFKPMFEKLIIINHSETYIQNLLRNIYNSINIPANLTIPILIDNYREVKNFIDTKVKLNLKPLLTLLAEGLFYTALYIIYITPAEIKNRIYPHFQTLDNTNQLISFRDMIKTQVIDNRNYKDILCQDSFLIEFLPKTGGTSLSMKSPFVSMSKSKSLKRSKKIDLNSTVEAYKKNLIYK